MNTDIGSFQSLMEITLYNDTKVGDLFSPQYILDIGQSIIGAVLILFAGYVFAGWLSRRIKKVALRYDRLDDTMFSFLANILRYAVMALTILVVLNSFGVETTSFIAVIGAAGLAIGLALQGTLSNVAAGVMIVLFKPMKIGDFIEVDGVMGTIKDITLNYTELTDLSNVQVIVPNANVWGNILINYSANKTRRAEWVFGVSYNADLKKAEETIRAVLMSDPRSMLEPAPFLEVNNLGDFSVDFLARVWVSSEDYFTYQAEMKRKVKVALDEAGVDIPFPTTTIIQQK